MTSPTFTGLSPASTTSSRVARAASQKRDTHPHLMLRKALCKAGLRYRKNVASISGGPDIVFNGARLAVFVDGDFWHGRVPTSAPGEAQAGRQCCLLGGEDRAEYGARPRRPPRTTSGWMVGAPRLGVRGQQGPGRDCCSRSHHRSPPARWHTRGLNQNRRKSCHTP